MGSRFQMKLSPDVAQLAVLRRRLADWLARCDVDATAGEAIILATHEAAANAIEHARGGAVVTGVRDEHRVSVVVRNPGSWTESDGGESRGRGLILMRGLMSSLDVATGPDESIVRMHLAL